MRLEEEYKRDSTHISDQSTTAFGSEMEGHDCFALKETDEHRQLRCVAFVAVAVSTMAVVCAVVTLPLLFNYVQDFQSHLMVETGFCKTRSRDMLLEMTALQLGKGHANRIKRGWLFGQWHPEKSVDGGKDVPSQRIERMSQPAGGQYGQPAAGYQPVVAAEATCCTCHQGPPGPVGSEGPPGVDGQDGTNGKDGTNGRDAQSIPAPTEDICIMCPAGPPGPMGPPGTKGPPGPKGSPGEPPKDGTPGDIGQQGQPGPIGQPGREGPRGASGQPGRLIPVSGPQGVPGPAGEPGQQGAKGAPGPDGQSFQGPPGPPGDAGKAGRSGRAGAPGPSGPPGQDGEVGSCDHCPEPRTPPGYFAGAGGGGRGDNYFN